MSHMELDWERFYTRWSQGFAVLMLLSLGVTYLVSSPWIWWVVTLVGMVGYFLQIPRYTPPWPWRGWGYANWVTAVRASLLFGVLALWAVLPGWVVFVWLLVVVGLDGVDGYVARRYGHSHKIGEAFDMEVDAAMVMWLAWIHVDRGVVGYWLLLPGSFKYLFTLLATVRPSVPMPDFPPKRVRSTLAVVFFLSLLAPWVLPADWSAIFLAGASLGIFISFGAAIVAWLLPRSESKNL